MRHITSTIAIALLVSVSVATAQKDETPSQRIGLFGNVDGALNSASFTALPTIPNCCPEFSSSFDIGWLGGLTYIKPFNSTWSLHLRLHYGGYGGTFQTDEVQPVIGPGGVSEQATIRHDLTTSFQQISIEPLAGYTIAQNFSLLGGITAGYVTSSTFDQLESLVSPADATFEDETRERNAASGNIPDASSIALGITIGATYDIPLNEDESIILSPEILFSISPISPVSGISYNIHHLRGGLALSFVPPEYQDSLYGQDLYEFARSVDAPTSVTPDIPFVTKVSAVGLDENGNETPLTEITIEEHESKRVRPLLPYIFFQEAAADIPDRYYKLNGTQRENFSEDNFYNLDAMVTYHQLLNIVGKRMTDNPDATITVSGHATDSESKANVALDRAKAVKSYLTKTWDIDEGRINTSGGGLPPVPSNTSTMDGNVENRRVEISSSDPGILAPVTSTDTMRVSTPAGVKFNTSIDPRVQIRSWSLFITSDGQLRKFYHDGNPVPESVTWRPTEETGVIPDRVRELGYLLTATDTVGAVVPSQMNYIPVRTVSLDEADGARIDRYTIVGFDQNSDELTEEQKSFIATVRSSIPDGASVTIRSHTDRTGSDSFNKQLSQRRADAVSRELGVPSKTVALGESFPVFDNGSPEGRFYNRTVEIIVETPAN